MKSTKWKRSSQRWFTQALLAICEFSWKQLRHENSILHDKHHHWKQREVQEIDNQIEMYKIQFSQTSYLLRDKSMFEVSLVRLHRYPTPIKQQWLFSVKQAQLRKIAANITPISQKRQFLTNWLSLRRLSNGGQGRITSMVTDKGKGTNQVINDTPSTISRPIILDDEDNNRSYVEVSERSRQSKKIRIRLPQPPFNNTVKNSNIIPRFIPLSTVSTVNYQYRRLLKDNYITTGYQDR